MYKFIKPLLLAGRIHGSVYWSLFRSTRSVILDSGFFLTKHFGQSFWSSLLLRCLKVKSAAVMLLFTLNSVQLMAHSALEAQIDALTAQLKEQPTNAELYLSRADVRRQHAEFELAFADLVEAARLKPGWSKVLLVRAKTFFDANKYQESVITLEEFLTAEPNHATALLLRGRCDLKLGQQEKAIADYSAALKAFAQPNPELYVERAKLQASMGRFDDAIRGLDEGQTRFGRAPTLQLVAIDLERQRGDFASALQRTDKLLQIVNQPGTLLLRAQLFEQAGRLTEAQKEFQSIIAALDARPFEIRSTETFNALRSQARKGLARVEARLSNKAFKTARNTGKKTVH